MPKYYPVLLDIRGKKCIVIGGGTVAERKVTSLLNAHAKVSVVSPELTGTLSKMAVEKKIYYIDDNFKEEYFEGAFLIIGATDNPETNLRIFRAATNKNILVNIVDSPDECNFIVPSVVEQGDLLIAVSTGGKSPAFAKKIRKELENQYGKAYGDFIQFMGDLRKKILSQFPDTKHRNQVFQALVDSEILDLFEKGLKQEAETTAEKIIKNVAKGHNQN